MAHAIIAMLDEGMNCSTIELKISYLSSVREGVMRAEGKVLKKGRSVAFVEGTVRCGDKLVATATASFAIHELR
jgi:uncharacterized protein (TIGR00369 family)